MPNGHSDPTDVTCSVGGGTIDQFTGIGNWTPDKKAEFNEGPGGVAFGFNRQVGNNKVTFDLKVRDTSRSLDYLYGLAANQTEVDILALVTKNLDSYPSGTVIGAGCDRGVLNPGTLQKGEGNSVDVVFKVVGIGPVRKIK